MSILTRTALSIRTYCARQPFRGLSDAFSGGRPFARPMPLRPREAISATQTRDWPIDIDGQALKIAKARKLGISTSTQKLNLVAKLIRRLSVQEAFRQLSGLLKKHRHDVSQTLAAAIVNARSFGMNENRLIVSEAFVGKGKYLKRIRPWHGKGRYGVEHKKYAHLTVQVQEVSDEYWEAHVLPKYVHLHRSKKEKERCVPENLIKPWEVRSQLDLSLQDTKTRVEELRSTLPKRRTPFPEGWQPDARDSLSRQDGL